MPEHAKEIVQPDYLLQGPGEYKIAELLSRLFNQPSLTDDFPTDIDDLPYPAFDLLRKNDYLVTMTSRGCPFRCTFCATYKIDKEYSQRQPHKVVEEILGQTAKLHVRDVAFYDDVLLLQPEQRIKPILHEIISTPNQIRFHTPNGLHGRYIDEELADLMYRSNFKTIRISLESVAKARQHDIYSKITPDEMTRAVHHLVQAGYKARDIETYVIMGLPGQPADEVIETIFYAHNLGVQVRLAAFSPIPGTVDYERAVANGYFPVDTDPLLTNNTIMPLFRTAAAFRYFHTIRQYTNRLNAGIKIGTRFFKPKDFRAKLKKALAEIPFSTEL
jgi:radical SAM superfamily enzyme YgiQ (UPF0313 family)